MLISAVLMYLLESRAVDASPCRMHLRAKTAVSVESDPSSGCIQTLNGLNPKPKVVRTQQPRQITGTTICLESLLQCGRREEIHNACHDLGLGV